MSQRVKISICFLLLGLMMTTALPARGQEADQETFDSGEIPKSLQDDPSLSDEEREARRKLREEYLRERSRAKSEEWIEENLAENFVPEAAERLADRAERMKWYEDAYLGMFIHWNPSSFTEYEMSFGRGRVKKEAYRAVAEKWDLDLDFSKSAIEIYDSLPQFFNPVKFDAAEMVGLARQMNAEYLIFVCKHHDGFCMWDTEYTDHKITNTPYGKDILAMIAEECHKQGIRLAVYYSIADYYFQPSYTREGYQAYIRYMLNQLEELLTEYGDVSIVWYDGGGGPAWPYKDMADWIHRFEPDALIRNGAYYQRFVGGQADYTATEYGTPTIPREKYTGERNFEWGFTLNGQWGFTSKRDANWLSVPQVIDRQMQAVSRGGNAVVNIAPNPLGEMSKQEKDIAKGLGEWNRRYNEGIEASLPGPMDFCQIGHATRKGQSLYLFLTKAPGKDGRDLTVPLYRLRNPIEKVVALYTDKQLPVQGEGEMRYVVLPDSEKDPVISVIRVDFTGELDVSDTVYGDVGRPEQISLPPYRAACTGEELKYYVPAKTIIGWSDPSDKAVWSVYIPEAGEYDVRPFYYSRADQGGTVFELCSEGQALSFTVEEPEGKPQAVRNSVGTLKFDRPGVYELVLSPKSIAGEGTMDIRNLTLQKK